jgi:NAD(P)-dependent dehydrogenase (short-subunit alcohol dehydrogenase family)
VHLQGKVVIMTGGGRGIGRAAALAMAREGAAVVVAARTTSEINQVAGAINAEGHSAMAVTADVTKPDQVRSLVDRTLETFGRIDVLVNNAGAPGRPALVRHQTLENWAHTLEANLTSAFLCTHAVLEVMIAQRRGKILNLSSSLARSVLPGMSAYSAAKAAIVHFSRVLAAEVAEFNIQVNAVWPGVVETRFHDAMRRATAEEAGPVLVERARRRPPLTPEDAAPLFVFLASEAADDITGQFVLIDDPAIQARVQALVNPSGCRGKAADGQPSAKEVRPSSD